MAVSSTRGDKDKIKLGQESHRQVDPHTCAAVEVTCVLDARLLHEAKVGREVRPVL